MSLQTISYSPINSGRWLVWTGFIALLILAPLMFSSGGSLSLLSLMGTIMIFALSYNMLLGQSGMLSFGHAVYSGLGAFFAIHAINLSASNLFFIPLSLVPLVGGIAGVTFGILFGYVTTKRSGTTFSMISLGIVELVFACSLMFPGFFGGEGGVSGNRVFGKALMGISFGPQIQVYYLIAAWLLISTVAMFAISHTPLGRIANAVRDNPERAEFIGYDTQRVRYLMLILSGFFAGISGGLSAINFEIVSAENVSAARSGAVLLFTFIGGIGFFFGPLLGAIIGVLLTVMLSEITKAWLLYLGLFFILMVMYAPGGLASIIMMNFRLIRIKKLKKIS
jgi:branched-chain amino acid transport system permease protein